MSPLPSEDCRALLALARRVITESVQQGRAGEAGEVASASLAKPCGAFVTLRSHGRLRGCIGRVEAVEPLAQTVAFCAVSAALCDPRFPPLRPDELDEIEIEISVLSPVEPITPERIEVGVHGLRVTSGRLRGVLLPHVATQYRWDRERFLEETCVKAGLPREAAKDPQTQIEAFTAQVFSESDFAASKKRAS